MQIYNTLTRSIEAFSPLNPPRVTMYCCGPTVYDFTHIGHIRKYLMDDIIRRSLELKGYSVDHVMNVTDVGHLTDDADSGEDKLEKGAKKTGKTVWEVAQFYTDFFVNTMKQMNIVVPAGSHFCKATDHVSDMIELITRLQEAGATYETEEAVYFSVEAFPGYGELSGQSLDEKKQAVRQEVHVDSGKKHPADFALWFKRTGRFANHTMHWESPWGDGFPGWHIECSAMSMKYLGEQIDIHTGGIDHIPVHHENEIAQSEAATGKHPFVKYWVHHNFLQVDGRKMSKSLENFYTLEDVQKKHIDPMALRLLFLQTHYRQEMNFTWAAAEGAQTAYERLCTAFYDLNGEDNEQEPEAGEQYLSRFTEALFDDITTPRAVAVMWEVLKSDLKAGEKKRLLSEMTKILGLELQKPGTEEIPENIQKLISERNAARSEKNWSRSDELRAEIQNAGFEVLDQGESTKVRKK